MEKKLSNRITWMLQNWSTITELILLIAWTIYLDFAAFQWIFFILKRIKKYQNNVIMLPSPHAINSFLCNSPYLSALEFDLFSWFFSLFIRPPPIQNVIFSNIISESNLLFIGTLKNTVLSLEVLKKSVPIPSRPKKIRKVPIPSRKNLSRPVPSRSTKNPDGDSGRGRDPVENTG